jgi:Flp pilus assembly protein TadD
MSTHRSSSILATPPRVGLRRLACLVASLVLAACSTTPTRELAAAPTFFDDAAFAPSTEPLDAADVFKLTPEMQAYVDNEILPLAKVRGLRTALTEALYTRRKLQLEYEASTTRNAAAAFEARQGNCLSLVIMTAAFAKALDMAVTFQQVSVDESWSRVGDLYFMSGHVNLQLQPRFTNVGQKYDRYAVYTIDFLPSTDTSGLQVHVIDEQTVLAMYMNNRAAEALAVGQVDNAYWRAREAVRLAPRFLSAYNTLAVVYLHHGDPARAEGVLHAALAQAPDDPRLLSNEAQALRRLGRAGDATVVEAHLAALEPYPPFYFYNRGEAALRSGDLATARKMFKRELERAPDYHEFHYGLAVADFGLGLVDEARSELAIALRNAVRRTDHDLYAAKLDHLKATRGVVPVQQPTVQ